MFDELNRPDWDSYFLAIANVVAQRSLDPATKCGCVVVNDNKSILSTGYNSPPQGCEDSLIPLTRPEKYSFMSHSEVNAIANAAKNGVSLNNSTFYITGHPCEVCFRSIINSGAKRIIFGNIGAKCVDDNTKKVIDLMNYNKTIELIEIKETDTIEKVLNSALYWINKKKEEL